MTTPEEYFLKTWKVTDGGRTDVRKGQILKIEKDAAGKLRFRFPDGSSRFGDGHWDEYQELKYFPDKGILGCRYGGNPHRGPVSVEIYKLSPDGIRCVVDLDDPIRPDEDPGEWTAEEEGGP